MASAQYTGIRLPSGNKLGSGLRVVKLNRDSCHARDISPRHFLSSGTSIRDRTHSLGQWHYLCGEHTAAIHLEPTVCFLFFFHFRSQITTSLS
jgi:hypothetical protein